ncbi:serine/threonine-protein kinase mos [Eurytemora carolleeae]|uniref:serine/threonine-protein kinase mos n=1 Tax=Eurytemora carolleeae TaxID=1294199 RepID=UPI000C756836|nr:serine/threonine-protein kinase mos [Eurytemora carolleeae]|eukprot:XP_023337254.1 serine/threonine-protein kinase mos-like [Eurytemora affinis]
MFFRGAYGTVVLGQWKGEKCAVKVMEKEQGVGVSARRRKSLESELQALKLEHENIVKVHGVFAAEERYSVIIMEYVGSRNLHRLLIETPDKVLGRSWLLGVGRQISSALNHCHSRGVVHMDIKPANVLVTSSGVCKLGDFGCSVGVDSGDVPLDHSLVGTPGYQAPEFLRGGLPHPLCDVYSFGILLWQLDSREVPFQGQHPQTIMFRCVSEDARPSTPTRHFINLPGFKKIYLSCWSSDVNDRPTACTIHSRLVSLLSSLSAPTSARSMTALRI